MTLSPEQIAELSRLVREAVPYVEFSDRCEFPTQRALAWLAAATKALEAP